jgi:hypothetical protein
MRFVTGNGRSGRGRPEAVNPEAQDGRPRGSTCPSGHT